LTSTALVSRPKRVYFVSYSRTFDRNERLSPARFSGSLLHRFRFPITRIIKHLTSCVHTRLFTRANACCIIILHALYRIPPYTVPIILLPMRRSIQLLEKQTHLVHIEIKHALALRSRSGFGKLLRKYFSLGNKHPSNFPLAVGSIDRLIAAQ